MLRLTEDDRTIAWGRVVAWNRRGRYEALRDYEGNPDMARHYTEQGGPDVEIDRTTTWRRRSDRK